MAERMQLAGELDQIGAMILFDMIGDADLSFPKDGNSTGLLNDIVCENPANIGHDQVLVGVQVSRQDNYTIKKARTDHDRIAAVAKVDCECLHLHQAGKGIMIFSVISPAAWASAVASPLEQ